MIPAKVFDRDLEAHTREMHLLLAFPMPLKWLSAPQRMQDGMAWWHLIDMIYSRRLDGDIYPVSAPRDVGVRILHTPEDVQNFVPRSGQPDYQLDYALRGTRRGESWVVGEFTYDGVAE